MFTLPPLPYDYSALDPWIDTATMKIHHDKHHQAYVDNLNKALEGHPDLLEKDISWIITNLDKIPEDIRTKVRNHGGGHFNHSLFWQIMGPKKQAVPPKFAEFVEPLTTAATGIFGSGWAWLTIQGGKLNIVTTPLQDNPLSQGAIPILGLDVWEHAYYLKYQNRRAEYIKNWWNVVNWEEVEKRLKDATG